MAGKRGRSSDWWERDYPDFPPSRPREAEGGIRAQSTRGAFGKSWWAKRWLAWLEGLGLGTRLTRGRTYARKGQVLEVAIEPGEVRARVQGSRVTPYQVHIQIPPLGPNEWRQVGAAIAARAAFAAALLAGRMPDDIEQAFTASGIPLFPVRAQDLRTECSCPDWSNPCKHVAAVYYLIGEEIDRDPFLLFRLRGMPRDALMTLLAQSEATVEDVDLAVGPEALPTGPEAFWRGMAAGPVAPPDATPGGIGLALMRRMGNVPFWRAARGMAEALEPAYRTAGQRAAKWLDGAAGPVGLPPAGGGVQAARQAADGATAPAAATPVASGGGVIAGGKSRDRAALAADLQAGVPEETLRARYDGRLLRPFLSARGDVRSGGGPAEHAGRTPPHGGGGTGSAPG